MPEQEDHAELARTASWAQQEKTLGRRKTAEKGPGVRQWYDVEAGCWRNYPIPDGALIEVQGQPVRYVKPPHYAADMDALLCEVCHHSLECDASRGGEHGPDVDFTTHQCPGV